MELSFTASEPLQSLRLSVLGRGEVYGSLLPPTYQSRDGSASGLPVCSDSEPCTTLSGGGDIWEWTDDQTLVLLPEVTAASGTAQNRGIVERQAHRNSNR